MIAHEGVTTISRWERDAMEGVATFAHDAHTDGSDARTRILLVDDEPTILSFVARILRGHGFTVDCAVDGAQALAMARAGGYELIVLDLVMPGVDGITTLKSIMAVRPEQAVMVLSALGDTDSKVLALELGAGDYLTKPFALAELLARVRTRLRQSVPKRSERFLRVGEVTLDLQRHSADAGNGQVMLSGREFELLHHLMRRAGEVCSREQLLAEVWDTQFDPGTNVIDVYIRRLRTKLGGDHIETLRSVGYALRAA
jgi:two-component system OmpR family response regulator